MSADAPAAQIEVADADDQPTVRSSSLRRLGGGMADRLLAYGPLPPENSSGPTCAVRVLSFGRIPQSYDTVLLGGCRLADGLAYLVVYRTTRRPLLPQLAALSRL